MNAKPPANRQLVMGTVLNLAVAAVLLLDAAMQFVQPAPLIEAMKQTGFQPNVGPLLAAIMTICALTLAIPRTSLLGAILTTGFLGGAIAAHVRIGEITAGPQLFCVLMGAAVWGGLYLRDERLRKLLSLGRQNVVA